MYLESDRKLKELHHAKDLDNQLDCAIAFQWNCANCNKKFESKMHLGRHRKYCLISSADEFANNGAQSGKMGGMKTVNNSHVMSSPIINQVIASTWECYKCHMTFNNSGALISHYELCAYRSPSTSNISERNRIWNCKLCDKTFTSKRKLSDHRHQAHQNTRTAKKNYQINDEKQYACNLCSEVFPTRRSVYEHVRKHNGEKALCNICGKFLSDRNNLNKHHQSVHLKQKKHSCTMCDKRYDSRYRLRIHLNSHKGIRNYSCEICPSKFISCAALTRHMKTIHVDEKKFVCTICSKGFKLANKLKTHMFVHTGIFEHPCQQCGKGFRQRSKLQLHIRQYHVITNE